MIATVKVLGLRARDFASLAGAAWRVVEYVHGGPAAARSQSPGSYYAARPGSGRPSTASAPAAGSPGEVRGKARGAAAGLVGLQGGVGGEELHRLLMGRHAVSGAWLVTGRGSAARTLAAPASPLGPDLAQAPSLLTLAQAAKIAGVGPTYLRRLAEDHELETATSSRSEALSVAQPITRDYLNASRDPSGRRWLVTREELGRFMAQRQPPTVVIGYDLTCSAPKSVSLLWSFGDENLRADITAALDAGVDAALAYLERHAVTGLVDGKSRPGLGLAAACYRHEISRSEEAHLHVHTIIANAVPVPVLDDTGQPVLDQLGVARVEWRALDGEVFLAHVKTAGFIGAAALRYELASRRGVEWGPVRNGVAELAAFPRGLLEAFSTRTGEVSDEFAQLVEAGFTPDLSTKHAAQRGSRAAKRVLSDPQVEAIQRDKLAATGWSIDQVQALAGHRDRHLDPPSPAQIVEFFDRLLGPTGLAQQQPMFTQRDVHQHVAAWAADRLNADDVQDLARRFLGDPRLVRMRVAGKRRRHQDEDTYTTTELLEAEDSLIALYRQGRTDHGGPPRCPVTVELAGEAIDAVNEHLQTTTGDLGAGLSEEQHILVRHLLASGDLVRPVIGPAGTGKTEAMRALVHAFAAAGYAVYGAANGGRQAEELHERLEIRSEVVTSWLTRLDHVPDPGEVWAPGTVLIVDEATQVSTRHAEQLLRYATRTGTVVVLVGDPTQLGSVGAGGWFTHLITTARTSPGQVAGLKVNQRQTGPHLATVRAALAALRPGLPESDREALSLLAQDGRIVVLDSREDMLAAVVEDWHTERLHTTRPTTGGTSQTVTSVNPAVKTAGMAGRSRMMAEHHRDTEALNRAARIRLTQDGVLSGPILRAVGREWQVGDEVITLTQAGHTLIPAGKPRSAYIRTGTVGIITAVHTTTSPDITRDEHQTLTVMFPGRGEVTIGWEYLTHAFPDGRDGGLAHAYALTAAKAEGTTMPTARALATDATSRAGLYVMLSRAKSDLRAYVVRRRDLEANLDDEDWLPVIRDDTGPMRALLEHLAGSRQERLASEHDPIAHAAHQFATRLSLAELTRMRRTALSTAGHLSCDRDATDGGQSGLVLYRAELAAAARIGNAAIAEPDPDLLARIGPRPANGPQLVVWEHAVAALAIYRARHGTHPDQAPDARRPTPITAHDMLGPCPPVVEGSHEQQWATDRRLAEGLAAAWAARLPAVQNRRFYSTQETVPRHRAIAGIHTLLTLGWDQSRITSALTADDVADVRAGAPVLEYRVGQVLEQAGTTVDAHPYQLLAPLAPAQEWQRAAELLNAAEGRHLARRSTGELAGELEELTEILTSDASSANTLPTELERRRADARTALVAATAAHHAAQQNREALERRRQLTPAVLLAAQRADEAARHHLATAVHQAALADLLLAAYTSSPPAWTSMSERPGAFALVRDRVDLIDAALAHQIDQAATQLNHEPPTYLTGLLGSRPQDPAGASQWQSNAIAVEHYRHHHLGLPYGTPAAPDHAPASEQALGPRPITADLQQLYDRLHGVQATLDLSASM